MQELIRPLNPSRSFLIMGTTGLSLTLWHNPNVQAKDNSMGLRNAFEGMYFKGCLAWIMVCCMGQQEAVPVNSFSTIFYNMMPNAGHQDMPFYMQVRSLSDDRVIWKNSYVMKAAMYQVLHAAVDMQQIIFSCATEVENAYQEKEDTALSTLIITETVIEKLRQGKQSIDTQIQLPIKQEGAITPRSGGPING